MKSILFVLPSLCPGGAERVFATLLNHFPHDRYQLNLALVYKSVDRFYEIPAHVKVYELSVSRVVLAAMPLLRLVWRIEPVAIFSALGHLNMLVIALKLLYPHHPGVFAYEGSTVSRNIAAEPHSLVMGIFYRFLYPRATRVICLCRAMLDDLQKHFAVPRQKMVVIYNPLDSEKIRQKAVQDGNPFEKAGPGPHIVCVGRLDPAKGYDEVLKALKGWTDRYPDLQLWLVGDGPLRQALAEQAGELDVTQHLNFVGFQRNPFRWVSHADLFLLASRYEGLPNALMEAIVLECPVWVKKHPGGAGEILAITGLGDRATPCLDLEQRLFEKPGRECAAKAEKVFQARAVVEQYLQLIETGSCG